MTKKIRVENADTSTYKVLVETWEKGDPDTLVSTQKLDHPAAMTHDGTYITSTRYLIVREAPIETPKKDQ